MGYFIDTIHSEKLSSAEKIRRLKFFTAYNFDLRPRDEQTREILHELELDQYDYTQFQNGDNHGVNEYGRCEWSPLGAAVEIGDEDIVTWLLDHKAKVNHLSIAGHTPMFMAAQKGNLNIFKKLYENNANLLSRLTSGCGNTMTGDSWKGLTVLDEAARYGRVDIVEFILSCDEMKDKESYLAQAEKLAKEVLSLLEQESPDVTERFRTFVSENQEWDSGKTMKLRNSHLCSLVGMQSPKLEDLGEIIKQIGERLNSIHRDIVNPIVQFQAQFRGRSTQKAYEAYMNRPDLNALVDDNKFDQAHEAIETIKKSKDKLHLL